MDFDTTDPAFNAWMADENMRKPFTDLRYVAAESILDNNGNYAAGFRKTPGEPSITECLKPAGYAAKISIADHPRICLKTTEGNYVSLRVDASNTTSAHFTDIVIFKKSH